MLLSTCFQRFQLSAVPKWHKRSLEINGQRVMEKKVAWHEKGSKGDAFRGVDDFSPSFCQFR